MMPDPEPRKNTRAAPTLLALITVFVLPIILAWWLAVVRPPVGESKLLNHGTLIRPPIDIASNPAMRSLEKIELSPGEWAMVYVGGGPCEAACVAALNKLATIRAVLGQGAIRVRVAALVDGSDGTVPGTVIVTDRQARSFLSGTLGSRLAAEAEHGIVFLDWRGQIMMYFEVDASSGDIKKDVKRLLRASKIK